MQTPIALHGPTFVSVADAMTPVGDWQDTEHAARADLCVPFHPPSKRLILESGMHFGKWQYRYCVRRVGV